MQKLIQDLLAIEVKIFKKEFWKATLSAIVEEVKKI
jgi:hypothetical protein